MESKTNRVPVLDVVKGILPLFVINTHYIWEKDQTLAGLFPFWNNLAVPFFMMISGYVYANSFEKNVERFEDAYEMKFLLKKALRYIIPFLMIFALEIISFSILGEGRGLRGWVDTLCTGGEGPGSYYVFQMMQFILVYPAIFFTMKKNPKRGLVGWFCVNLGYEFLKEIVHLDWQVYRLVFLRFVFIVSVGTFLYINKEVLETWKWIASFIVGFVFLLATNYLGYYTRIINTKASDVSLMSAFYVAPILFLLITKFKDVKCAPLSLMGKASFNIFLMQMFYFNFAENMYSFIDSVPIRLLINTIVSVVVGVLFYLLENKLTTKVISKI